MEQRKWAFHVKILHEKPIQIESNIKDNKYSFECINYKLYHLIKINNDFSFFYDSTLNNKYLFYIPK